jgi:hypothetical protein
MRNDFLPPTIGTNMNDQIHQIIDRIESFKRNLPLTFIFNEGWQLSVVLKWFQQNPDCTHILSFDSMEVKWFSEALLPSPFLPRYRGDKLSES